MTLPIALFAMMAPPAGGAQGGAAPAGNPFMGMIPLLLICAIFYFIMIRPQQRKEKERRKQIEEMRAGTRVLLTSGMIGTIVEAKKTTFRIEVAPGVVCEFARGAVTRALKDDEVVSAEER